MSVTKFCPTCGVERTSAADAFCRGCGAKLPGESTATTPPAPATSTMHRGVMRRPWVRWTAALVFGAIVVAVATSAIRRSDDGSTALPDGQAVSAISEDEALVEGFMVGCEENYTSAACVCLTDLVFTQYSPELFRQVVGDLGSERGISSLLKPIQSEAEACTGHASPQASAAMHTAPDVVLAVANVLPDDPCQKPLKLFRNGELNPQWLVTQDAPRRADDGTWRLGCWVKSGPIERPDGTTFTVSGWQCYVIDDATLEVRYDESYSLEDYTAQAPCP